MWLGPHLGQPPPTGKLCLQLLGLFTPTTNLVYQDPNDPLIVERWGQTQRPPLINIGGHRLAQVGQEIIFDASDSQTDEDGVLSSVQWDFGDGHVTQGMLVRHAYSTAGLYTVTATAKGRSTQRWVRIVDDLSQSALDVVRIDELSGSVETGWRCTFTVAGDATALSPGQGVILYIYDALDRSWRDLYRRRVRDLARRTAFTTSAPPIPAPDDRSGHYTELGYPSGGCWDPSLVYAEQIQTASAKTGVPPNLLLAVIATRSCGNPNLVTNTGNSTCPRAYGLAQLAPGCTWFSHTKDDLLNPDRAIMILAQELAVRYRQCGRWDDAVRALLTNSCSCDDSSTLVTAPCIVAEAIMDAWDQADRAMGGGGEEGYGNVLFVGYVTEDGIARNAEQQTVQVTCVDTLTFCDVLVQRQEAFFEADAAQFAGGGTFMMGPPMRSGQVIHHLVTEHTNIPQWHDVVLDWSGPRFAQITAPEGPLSNAIREIARNEFSWAYGDRYGRIRYERQPHYRGRAWFDEIARYAITIDPTLATQIVVTERQMSARVGWVKLAGSTSTNSCQVFGEYPCSGPPQPHAGRWVYEQGFVYDDHTVLCAMAAYHYAYLNRRWDAQITLPWRHDLDVGDIIRIPHKDPSGRYDWRGLTAPIFVIKAIAYQMDTGLGQMMVTLTVEELTSNTPCSCPPPSCPEMPGANLPCSSCLGGGGSCSVSVLTDGWRSMSYQVATGTYLINERLARDPVALPITVHDWYGSDPQETDGCQTVCGNDGTCFCIGCDELQPHPREDLTPELVEVSGVRQQVKRYSGEPVIEQNEQQPNLLTAYYSDREEVQEALSWRYGQGEGIASARLREEEISWATLVVRALDNSRQKVIIKIKPVAGSPGASGLLMVVRTNEIAKSDPFGFVGIASEGAPTADGPDGGNGVYGSPVLIAQIPAEPVDDWLTYEVELPGNADGIFYAVGIGRVLPGPRQSATLKTPKVSLFQGTYTISEPHGCDPQVLQGAAPDLCCAPFTCLTPRVTGQIAAWLSSGQVGLRDLDAFEQASPRTQCDILVKLSGQPLGAHRSLITANGERMCDGVCTVTRRDDIQTEIRRSTSAGAFSCQIEFDWEQSGCRSGGDIGSPPPTRQCPEPGATSGSGLPEGMECVRRSGDYIPTWSQLAGDSVTIGSSLSLATASGAKFGAVRADVVVPSVDHIPAGHKVTLTGEMTDGEVVLYATGRFDPDQDWGGQGPAHFLWGLRVATTAIAGGGSPTLRWEVFTPTGRIEQVTGLSPASFFISVSWLRDLKTLQIAFGQDTRTLAVQFPPQPDPIAGFVLGLRTYAGTTKVNTSVIDVFENGACPGEAQGTGAPVGSQCLDGLDPVLVSWTQQAGVQCTGVTIGPGRIAFSGGEGSSCILFSEEHPGFAFDGTIVTFSVTADIQTNLWGNVGLGFAQLDESGIARIDQPILQLSWHDQVGGIASTGVKLYTALCATTERVVAHISPGVRFSVNIVWNRTTEQFVVQVGDERVVVDGHCLVPGRPIVLYGIVGASDVIPQGTTTHVEIIDAKIDPHEVGGCDQRYHVWLGAAGTSSLWAKNRYAGPGWWGYPGLERTTVVTDELIDTNPDFSVLPSTQLGAAVHVAYIGTDVIPPASNSWYIVVEGEITDTSQWLFLLLLDKDGYPLMFQWNGDSDISLQGDCIPAEFSWEFGANEVIGNYTRNQLLQPNVPFRVVFAYLGGTQWRIVGEQPIGTTIFDQVLNDGPGGFSRSTLPDTFNFLIMDWHNTGCAFAGTLKVYRVYWVEEEYQGTLPVWPLSGSGIWGGSSGGTMSGGVSDAVLATMGGPIALIGSRCLDHPGTYIVPSFPPHLDFGFKPSSECSSAWVAKGSPGYVADEYLPVSFTVETTLQVAPGTVEHQTLSNRARSHFYVFSVKSDGGELFTYLFAWGYLELTNNLGDGVQTRLNLYTNNRFLSIPDVPLQVTVYVSWDRLSLSVWIDALGQTLTDTVQEGFLMPPYAVLASVGIVSYKAFMGVTPIECLNLASATTPVWHIHEKSTHCNPPLPGADIPCDLPTTSDAWDILEGNWLFEPGKITAVASDARIELNNRTFDITVFPFVFRCTVELLSRASSATIYLFALNPDSQDNYHDFSLEIYGPDVLTLTKQSVELCPGYASANCAVSTESLGNGPIPVEFTVWRNELTARVGNITLSATDPGVPVGPWKLRLRNRMGDGVVFRDLEVISGYCRPRSSGLWDGISIGGTPGGTFIPAIGDMCPVDGACGNWPTAEAINARISLSEQQNGRRSPLHGMGEEFLRLGAKYGVNPGIVCAILQRESQLASDGSFLPTNANNFGGLTGSGPCGSVFYIDRNWAVFCDPAQGLEGVFARLKEPQYTSTAGTMEAVMAVYSPPFENDWDAMWQTFRAVAQQLGITIEPSTPVYSSQPECTSGPAGIPIPSPPPGGSGYGGYWTMFEYALHAVGARITQGPWGSYSHSQCDCYDFGCPMGTPIYPVLPGVVVVSEATSGVYTPNVIVVQTQYGNLRYAHLSTRNVVVGQQVGLETLLGYSGSAGTGPHLHLGLDGGTSSYSLDQVLYAAGVAMAKFPWA